MGDLCTYTSRPCARNCGLHCEEATDAAVGRTAGLSVVDPNDPFPDKTDAELGFAYRMMVKAKRGGLMVDFMTGDISLPRKG